MSDCNRCNGTGFSISGHFVTPEWCPECLGSGKEVQCNKHILPKGWSCCHE